MNRIELEKNRLDLAYSRYLQLLNTVLLLGAGSFITYLVALILDMSKIFQYTLILVIIFFLTLIFYRKIDFILKKISEDIRELK